MRLLPFFLAASLYSLALPARAGAQQRGFRLDEVEKLLRSHVSSARVLVLAQQRCIHFVPDDEALARLASAGATQELLDGLRGPGQCKTFPASPGRESAPDTAPRPPAASTPVHPWNPGFLGVGYTATTFRADGSGRDGRGQGAAVEIGLNVSSRFALFLHGGYADVTPDGGDAYGLWYGDLGVRLYLFAPDAPVRPFVDVAGTGFGLDFTDPEEEPAVARGLEGIGVSGAAGVRVALSRRVAIEAGFRRLAGSLTDARVGDETEKLEEPVRARGGRLSIGLKWSPAAP